MNDESKLPKWAQRELTVLRDENERLQRQVNDPTRGGSATAFLWHHKEDVPLADDHVTFKVDGVDYYVFVRDEGGETGC